MQVPAVLLPTLPGIKASMLLSKPVLTIVLVLFFLVYSVVSSVLVYHWSAYGMKSRGALVAETLFLFVSVVLFTFSGLSVFYF